MNISPAKKQAPSESTAASVLRLIATGEAVTRQDVAAALGLSKATVSGVCGELARLKYISETDAPAVGDARAGRKPIRLALHPESPLSCGMLIRRQDLSVILAGLDGGIIACSKYNFSEITAERLVDELVGRYRELSRNQRRRIIAAGIASLGPVNTLGRSLACPSDFYGIRDLPIADIVERETGLPVYFMHDTNAAAIAERLNGAGRVTESYVYLHILNGIGASFVLDGSVYEGIYGNSGEIGHTSIDFRGAPCKCGNTGCLELYANLGRVSREIDRLRSELKVQCILPKLAHPEDSYGWGQVLSACARSDFAALSALDEFCGFLASALANTINLLNIDTVIVGCEGGGNGVLEGLLERKLNDRLKKYLDIHVSVRPSPFMDNAPLVGSAAIVSNLVFSGGIPL